MKKLLATVDRQPEAGPYIIESVATDFPQFGTDALHLIREGPLWAAQCLGDCPIRDAVVLLPESEDGVGFRIEFPEPRDQAGQKVSVSCVIFQKGTSVRNDIHQSGVFVFALWRIQGDGIGFALFSVHTDHIAEPPVFPGAVAETVVLHLFPVGVAIPRI